MVGNAQLLPLLTDVRRHHGSVIGDVGSSAAVGASADPVKGVLQGKRMSVNCSSVEEHDIMVGSLTASQVLVVTWPPQTSGQLLVCPRHHADRSEASTVFGSISSEPSAP